MLSIQWVQNADYYLDATIRKRRRRRRRGNELLDDDVAQADDLVDDEPMTLAPNPDYYFQASEPPGQWCGEGSQMLGLVGEVTSQQLSQLFEGFDPHTRKKLVANAGRKKRQKAWDLTFSAPKSVSVLWSQADPVTRRRIEELHFEAVQEALQYLQDVAALTRRGKGGKTVEKTSLVVAAFQHGTSRELDPGLHEHFVVLNLGVRKDGSTGAILSKPLYRHKLTAGAVYRAACDAKFQGELGLRTERDGASFKLVGVPQELCDEQSKRGQQIKGTLKSTGNHSAKAAAVATLSTRRPKGILPTRDELRKTWQETNAKHGFGTKEAAALLGQTKPLKLKRALRAALRAAMHRLLATHSHFTEQMLIREVALEAQGRGIPAAMIIRAVRAYLANATEIVPLQSRDNERHYTTKEILALEREMLKQVELHKQDTQFVLPKRYTCLPFQFRLPIRKSMSQDDIERNQEQRKVVEHLICGPGSIQVVQGMAGTGKTHVLGICRRIWKEVGYKVVGMSLAGVAARNLQEGSGIKSDTLSLRQSQLDFPAHLAKHNKRQFQRFFFGKRTYFYWKPFRLTKRTIVVLDEVGMVGTRQLAKLIDRVVRAGAKLVLVGDWKQLQPIEAGGPMKAIAQRAGHIELKHIVRQKLDTNDASPDWARRAVRYFARGWAMLALQLFKERGRLLVADDRDEAMLTLVRDWSVDGIRQPKDNVILAARNADVEHMNDLCQQARLASLRGALPDSIKVGPIRLYVGDRVLFTDKSRLLGIENGDRGVVVAIHPRRKLISVQLDRQKQPVLVPLKEYCGIRRGYAMTVHKAQGATFENAFVLVGGSMQDLHLSYVQASRAKENTRLYVDRFEAGYELKGLAQQMSQSREKDLAHDLLDKDEVTRTLFPGFSKGGLGPPPSPSNPGGSGGGGSENPRQATPEVASTDKTVSTPTSAPSPKGSQPVPTKTKEPTSNDRRRDKRRVERNKRRALGRKQKKLSAFLVQRRQEREELERQKAARAKFAEQLSQLRLSAKESPGGPGDPTEPSTPSVPEPPSPTKQPSPPPAMKEEATPATPFKSTEPTQPSIQIPNFRLHRPRPSDGSIAADNAFFQHQQRAAKWLQEQQEAAARDKEAFESLLTKLTTAPAVSKDLLPQPVQPAPMPANIVAPTHVSKPDLVQTNETSGQTNHSHDAAPRCDQRDDSNDLPNEESKTAIPQVAPLQLSPRAARPSPLPQPQRRRKVTDLSHLKISLTTDPEWTKAAIRQYGQVPGGIVVKADAWCPMSIERMSVHDDDPTCILINDSYVYDTRLTAEDVACVWHTVVRTNQANLKFGALTQFQVIGMDEDLRIAETYRQADECLGRIAYGRGSHGELPQSTQWFYVNPFRKEAKNIAKGHLDDMKRHAPNRIQGIVPQVFFTYSSTDFSPTSHNTLSVSSSLTAAFAAIYVRDKKVIEDETQAKARFPYVCAAMEHLISYFPYYVRKIPFVAETCAIADLVQLLRVGKRHKAEMLSTPKSDLLYQGRSHLKPPSTPSSYRTPEFECFARETAKSIQSLCSGWGFSHPAIAIADYLGLVYAEMANDTNLIQQFAAKRNDYLLAKQLGLPRPPTAADEWVKAHFNNPHFRAAYDKLREEFYRNAMPKTLWTGAVQFGDDGPIAWRDSDGNWRGYVPVVSNVPSTYDRFLRDLYWKLHGEEHTSNRTS